jgi:hypothetical protein
LHARNDLNHGVRLGCEHRDATVPVGSIDVSSRAFCVFSIVGAAEGLSRRQRRVV